MGHPIPVTSYNVAAISRALQQTTALLFARFARFVGAFAAERWHLG